MMKNMALAYKLAASCIALFMVLLACPSATLAGMRLEAPQKVARGDAFVAKAFSDEALDKFIFYWRGKNIAIKSSPAPEGGAEAIVMLPVPLDEKSSQLSLSVAGGKAARAPNTVNVIIALFDRKRPVQRLNVDKKYVDPPAAVKQRIKSDREKVRAALATRLPERLWEVPFQRPVPGSVSSLFGLRRVFNGQPRGVHRGLDLRGAHGTPIRVCADGQVVLVDNLYFSGNTVYVNHGDGVFTAYLHMSEAKARPGQRVSRGDVIGLVGATGRVTGPHLHLSMIAQGQSVDPRPWLENKEK